MSTVSFDNTGKTVIVTGAERGIGLAIATAFAICLTFFFGAAIILLQRAEEKL